MSENSVEILYKDGRWVVRLMENGAPAENDFALEEHAQAWAAGQRMRLAEAVRRAEARQDKRSAIR